jgi:hypothetical protein
VSEDKINDSMISQEEPKVQQPEKEQSGDGNNLSDFKDMG